MTTVNYRKSGASAKAGRIFMNLYAILSSLSCLFPIVWLIYSSLKTQSEFDTNSFSLPVHPTLLNYIQVFTTTNMFRYMLNSVFVSVISVSLILFLSFIVGYFLSRFEFKGKKVIFSLFLLGMLVPVHSLMVPLYVMFSRLHINNHLAALILPYFCFQLPVGIYLVESYVHSIPLEMEDAAAIDGAPFTQTLFSVILPMVKPVLVTIAIITFFFCWNEFSFALILTNGTTMRTVPLGLALFSGSYTTNYPVMMAAMVIATLPTLILYVVFSKNIMQGMVAGAVKG
jgi:raffinose/stachyose/melibiose transport system permease protein